MHRRLRPLASSATRQWGSLENRCWRQSCRHHIGPAAYVGAKVSIHPAVCCHAAYFQTSIHVQSAHASLKNTHQLFAHCHQGCTLALGRHRAACALVHPGVAGGDSEGAASDGQRLRCAQLRVKDMDLQMWGRSTIDLYNKARSGCLSNQPWHHTAARRAVGQPSPGMCPALARCNARCRGRCPCPARLLLRPPQRRRQRSP